MVSYKKKKFLENSFGCKSKQQKSKPLKNQYDDENQTDENEAQVTVDNIKINDLELNELEDEFGTFNYGNATNENNDDENHKIFDFKTLTLVYNDTDSYTDFDAESKISSFLYNDNNNNDDDNYDTTNTRKSRELSCIHEEDHHEDLSQTKQNDSDMNEKDSTVLTDIFNNSDKSSSFSTTSNDLSSCYSIEKAKEMFLEDNPVLMTTPTLITGMKSTKLNPTMNIEDSRNDALSSFNYFNNTSTTTGC
jgi:hypothetical protein